MVRTCLALGALLALCGGCDDDEAEAPSGGSGERVYMDLLDRVHLADVDHHGTFVDFGTPARMKYTVGQWRSGWISDEVSGDTTFSYVGDTGRMFFEVDHAGPVTLRFRAKAVGSRNLSLYTNGHAEELVRLEEGDELRDYDITIPAEHVQVGENYLLLRFGATARVGSNDVSAAVESVRIVEGSSIPGGEYHPPRYGELVQEMAIGGETRRAIAVRRPTRVTYYVDVPRGARLDLGLGAEGETPAHVTIAVTPEGGERAEVYSGDVHDAWDEHSIDLGRFVGSIVRLDFAVTGEGSGRVALGTPRIVVPEVQVPEGPRLAKNVVVLLVDTLRADKLRPFNPRTRVRTPVIDQLAQSGAVFLAAQAPENWTKPSVASVLTGLYPSTHGTKESESRLPDDVLMLSEQFHANGLRTASFIANGYVSDRFGFAQGWDYYTNFIREGKNTDASAVFAEAGDWIEHNRDQRFFVYVQTIDPHVPYDPPDEFLRMYDSSNYSGRSPRDRPRTSSRARRTALSRSTRAISAGSRRSTTARSASTIASSGGSSNGFATSACGTTRCSFSAPITARSFTTTARGGTGTASIKSSCTFRSSSTCPGSSLRRGSKTR